VRSVLPTALAALVALAALPALAKQPVIQIDGAALQSHKPPWRARVRIPRRGIVRGYALRNPSIMPPEPSAPSGPLDVDRLASALVTVCDGKLKAKRAKRYARALARAAEQFKIDPFVLGGLMRVQSGCSEHHHKKSLGRGLLRLRYAIHRPFIQNGSYHYWIRDGRVWRARSLVVGRYAFTPRSLRTPEVNLHYGAALLAIYTEQARDLDRAFPQVKHRHPVSHMIWGDRVRGTATEERVLRDRRRMLFYYTGVAPKPRGRYRGMAIHSPLDGAPRKITSGFHNKRGYRRHSSLDYYSHTGEPVRAIADGKIYFAGYQRRRGMARRVSPKWSRHVRRSKMGIGGLFVLIDHKHRLQSGYFHLSDFTVKNGQRVKAGQLIGHVGRTGIKRSPAHLHFEMRRKRRRFDPAPLFRDDLLPLNSTYWGRHISGKRYRWHRGLRRRYLRRRRARRRRAKLRKLRRKLRRLRKFRHLRKLRQTRKKRTRLTPKAGKKK
jgi:murein DD-endopeptidase MepM/ murein hydrolase activator NlpD